jgi:uncharacterized protein (TIGR02246 family)
MKTRLLCYLALPALLIGLAGLPGSAENGKDDNKAISKEGAAIEKNAEAFVEAFHKGDAVAVAALWTDDGEYTDSTGRRLKGREAIQKAFEQHFAENKGLKIRIDSLSLRFVTPDVAIEEGTTEVIQPDGAPAGRSRFSNVHVKKDGQWYLGTVSEAAFNPPGNREHLQGLEWAIGDWAEEKDKGPVERLSLDWAEGENFIVATFSTTHGDLSVGSATQWIGWDPTAKRIRSWIFDASGAFGEGSWTSEGKKWVIKTDSILQDGKKATATYEVSAVDPDTITLQARDRSVDGKAMPETKAVTLKRVK